MGAFLLHLDGERYRKLAEGAAAFVRRCAVDDGEGGWKWTKMHPPRKEEYPVQWCHGSPGIGLFFLAMEDAGAVARCVAATERTGRRYRKGGCQCHGLSGNAELLIETGRVGTARAWAADLIGEDGVKTAIGRHAYGPGFMTGLAGIGRFFLRLHDPERFPVAFMVR